jgi:peptide/nickel transport system substrate-binding protein
LASRLPHGLPTWETRTGGDEASWPTATTVALSRRATAQTNARTLLYGPQADLTVIGLVMTTAYITSFHAIMVWDQLCGIDGKVQP